MEQSSVKNNALGIQVNKITNVRDPKSNDLVSSRYLKKKNLLASWGNLSTDWINDDSCFSYDNGCLYVNGAIFINSKSSLSFRNIYWNV